MIDGYWISTVILIAMSLGIVYFRITSQTPESNWPLVYYFFVILHQQLFPEGLSEGIVFSTAFASMLIRFEFMSGWLLTVVQGCEFFGIALIAYSLFRLAF